jgi:hypothetical protein
MTHHYVNLISWKYFIQNSANSKIYIDTLSLQFLMLIFGCPTKRRSGIDQFVLRPNAIFLASKSPSVEEDGVYVLPFFNSLEEVKLNNDIIESVRNYKYIYIGISSPKQDKLAKLLSDVFPEKEVYCYGAALGGEKRKLGKLGLNWLMLLLDNPKRFRQKIKLTSKEFIKIVFNKGYQKKFKLFIKQYNQQTQF